MTQINKHNKWNPWCALRESQCMDTDALVRFGSVIDANPVGNSFVHMAREMLIIKSFTIYIIIIPRLKH